MWALRPTSSTDRADTSTCRPDRCTDRARVYSDRVRVRADRARVRTDRARVRAARARVRTDCGSIVALQQALGGIHRWPDVVDGLLRAFFRREPPYPFPRHPFSCQVGRARERAFRAPRSGRQGAAQVHIARSPVEGELHEPRLALPRRRAFATSASAARRRQRAFGDAPQERQHRQSAAILIGGHSRSRYERPADVSSESHALRPCAEQL